MNIEKIYCPKCGSRLHLSEVVEADALKMYRAQGYSQGWRGRCACGVVALLLMQPLPLSPSFTLMIDVYEKAKEVIVNA